MLFSLEFERLPWRGGWGNIEIRGKTKETIFRGSIERYYILWNIATGHAIWKFVMICIALYHDNRDIINLFRCRFISIAWLIVPWEQSLISPRVENKALPFLCLISVEHALFPILCQNMSKITCIFRMTAKFREPIACSYRYMLGACNCTCCTITTI
jgi:hypothetical protein